MAAVPRPRPRLSRGRGNGRAANDRFSLLLEAAVAVHGKQLVSRGDRHVFIM